jgi:hypothetical protein
MHCAIYSDNARLPSVACGQGEGPDVRRSSRRRREIAMDPTHQYPHSGRKVRPKASLGSRSARNRRYRLNKLAQQARAVVADPTDYEDDAQVPDIREEADIGANQREEWWPGHIAPSLDLQCLPPDESGSDDDRRARSPPSNPPPGPEPEPEPEPEAEGGGSDSDSDSDSDRGHQYQGN